MKRLILSLMTVFSFVVQPALAYAATTPAMSYPYSATTIYSYARGKNAARLAELSVYDMEATDAYGNTAVCLAVQYHNEEAYYNLIDAGANPNPPCMRDLETMRPRKSLFAWPKAGYALAAIAVGGGIALASGSGGGGGNGKCKGYTSKDCPKAQHITETCEDDSSYHKCAANEKNTEKNCAIFVVNKDECQVCQPAYYLDNGNCEERTVTEHCEVFVANADRCKICEDGYYLSSDGACYAGSINHCKKYANVNRCSMCEDDYVLTENADACVLPIDHCASYSSDGTCSRCDRGYMASMDKTVCVPEIEHCSYYNNDGTCHTCTSGYSKTTDGMVCVPTIPHCTNHNEDGQTCNLCESGYHLSTDKTACVLEIEGCADYNRDGTCQACESNYPILENGKCYTNDSYCVKVRDMGQPTCPASQVKDFCKLQDNITLNKNYWGCKVGPENCQTADQDAGTCLICNNGYYVDESGQCQPQSVAHCDNDYVPNKNECKTCENLYYLSNGQCLSIEDPHCVTSLRNEKECSVCETGYYPDSDGVCQPQNVPGCDQFMDNTNICTKCINLHYLDGNSCPDITDKEGCANSNGVDNRCDSCVSGYYQHTDGKCYSEQEICALNGYTQTNCQSYETKVYCQIGGQTHENYMRCDEGDIPHCIAKNADHTCAVCENKYYPTNGGAQCSRITSYETCSSGGGTQDVCVTCVSGYYPDAEGQCQQQNVANCDNDYVPNKNECRTCKNLYYLSDGQCPSINDPHCVTSMTNAKRCEICATGYYPDSNGVCQPQYIPECAEYTPNTNTCTRCNPLHYLNNNTCPDITDKTGCANSDGIHDKCSACQSLYNFDSGKCYNDNDYCAIVKNMGTPSCTATQTKSFCELERGSGLQNENYWTCVGDVDENCEIVDAETGKCTKCKNLYYPNLSGICVNITDTHCTESDGEHNACTTCNNDYYLNGGSCYTEQQYCTDVLSPSYPQTTACDSTTKYPVFCPLPGTSPSSTYRRCETGTVENCTQYSQTAEDTCTQCKANFYLSGNTCIEQTPIFGCKTYLEGEAGCAECLEGFDLSNKSCTRNSSYVSPENYQYYVWNNSTLNTPTIRDDSDHSNTTVIGYTATPNIVQDENHSSNTQFPEYHYEYDVYNARANGAVNITGRIELDAEELGLQNEGWGGRIIGLSTPVQNGSFAGSASAYNSASFSTGDAEGHINIYYRAPSSVITASDTQFAVYGIYSRANNAYNSYALEGSGAAKGDIVIDVANRTQNYGIYAKNAYNAYGENADGYIGITAIVDNKTPVIGIYGSSTATNANQGKGEIFINSLLDTSEGATSYAIKSDGIAYNTDGGNGKIQLLAQNGIALRGVYGAINAVRGGTGTIEMPYGGMVMIGKQLANASNKGSVGTITVGQPNNTIKGVDLYSGDNFTNASDEATATINIYGTLKPLGSTFSNVAGNSTGVLNIYTKDIEPTASTTLTVLNGADNIGENATGTGTVNIELGSGWVNGQGHVTALSGTNVDGPLGGKGIISIVKDHEGGSYVPYASSIIGVRNGNMYNSESSVTISGVTAENIYGMYYDTATADAQYSAGSIIIYSNDYADHEQNITGMHAENDATVENRGRIVISSSVQNKYINGMYASNGATATNKHQITIEMAGTASADAVHGMLAQGDGAKVINDTSGAISITVPSGTKVYGLRAIDGASLENRGTIEINTQLYSTATSNTTNAVPGSTTAYFTSYEPTTTELSSAIIDVEPDAQIVNSGNIVSNSALRMTGGGRMLMMRNANITAPSVSGTLELSSDIVSEGNEDVYVTSELVVGNTEDLAVTSQSQMFTAAIVDDEENENTVNGVLTRKPFETLTKSAKLANYLEKNYQGGNAEEFYTRLKATTTSEEFDKVLSKELGLCLIPNFAQENFNVFRSLGSLITDNLYSKDMTQERMMVGYDYLGLSRDSKGDVTGYENSAHSSYFIGDTALNKRSRFGLGVSITKFMSDYDDDSDRDEMFAQVLASYMYDFGNKWRYAGVLHGGYGWGDYTRRMNHGDVDGYLHDWIYGLRNELRYGYETPFALIEPQLEMNFTGYYQHRIREESKEGSVLMRGTNNFSAESGIGLYAGKEFNLAQYGKFKGRIGGSYYHEWAHPYHSIEARLRGTDGYYRIKADDIFRRDRFVISADIIYTYKAFDFYLRGSEYFEKDDVAVFNAGVKYNF
ncbi:MAG: hypothetical protein IJ778_02080 [Alphaproteobacteria bacterium]|nr:hypothetical protein [Alphaproteobacteria bacterium]